MDVFDLKGVLTLDASKFESGLRSAGSAASSFGSGIASGMKKIAGITTAALGAATAVTGKFVKDAVQTGMAFDAMMGQVGATMGKDVDQMEQEIGSVDVAFGEHTKHFEGTMREFALFMGQNTKFSATEAAQALNYMALAGYKTQDSMQMLPAVLNMAAAGAMDLGRASDMITDTQSALGLSFERTNQMVDEFAKAASSGNTTVEMLGEAFLKVGGLAKELNGGIITTSDGVQHEIDGIQELEIAFTAMANAGIKGNEAGTHMRNMLLKLSSPTDKGAQAFEDLGVAVFDTEGNMRSLADIFSDLNTGLSKVTQAEKLQAIGNIFNARDTASAEALLGAIEGTVEYEGQVYALSSAYEKWGDAIYDVNQGFKVTASSWDYLGEQILDSEGAAAAMSSRQLNNLKGSITLFKSALETAKITVSDKLTPALREFIDFGTEGLQKLVDGFNEGGLQGAMDAFGEILSDGLQKVIKALPNLTEVAGNLLKTLGKGLLDNIDAVSDAATSVLTLIADLILQGLPGFLRIMGEIGAKLGEWIMDNADTILDGIQGVIFQIVDFIADNAGAIFEGWLTLVGKVLERLPTIIRKITSALPKVIRDVANAIVKNAPILIKGATETVVAIAQALPTILMALVEAAPTIIITVIDALVENMPILIEGLIGVVGKIVENLPEIVTGIVKAIPTIIDQLFDKENGFLSYENIRKWIDGFIELVAKIVDSMDEIISYLLTDGIPSVIASILNAFGLDVNDPDSLAGKLFKVFKDAMEFVAPAFDFLGEAAKEVFGIIVQAFSDPKGALKRALEDMVTLIRNAITDVIEAIHVYAEAYNQYFEEEQSEARLNQLNEVMKRMGYIILDDGTVIRPGTAEYEEYMANHKGTSGGTYFGEGEAPVTSSGGGIAKRGTPYSITAGVINRDYWGHVIEPKEPQEVNINLDGDATITVEGANDEETFKKVNAAMMKRVQNDSRFYLVAGGD